MKFRFEITLLLFIFASTAILQGPYLFEFPGFIHGWAQVDRYALSMGFLRNGFDLLHPETYVYNPIYPGDFLSQSSSTISAIDFPVHDYFVALLMKLSGVHSPWLFRAYVILMGCVGLFYLGKLARLIVEDEVKALFAVVFAAFSPVFVYYQGSLLPSVPSLALTIAGVYYYFRFRSTLANKHMHLSMVLLGIALLSRTTYVIPFIAVLGMEFLSILKLRKIDFKRYTAVIPIVVLFFLYRWHNDALRNEYGSIFLHRLLPAESREEAWFLLNYVWEHWRLAYFSSVHYWAIALLAIATIVVLFISSFDSPLRRLLISFAGIYMLGCLLFAAAMLKQFQDHDYYFLDTFYLPCILIVIALLSFLPKAILKIHHVVYVMLMVAFVGFAFRMPLKSQRYRHEAGVNNRLQNTIENFSGSAEYLDALGIPRTAKMLVMNAVSPNTALTLMDRKGLVEVWSVKEMMEHALKWDFDYIVFENEYFQDHVYRDYPEVLSRLRKVGSNGKITVCVSDDGNAQTLQEFLGLTASPVLDEVVDFETTDAGPWKGYITTVDTAYSGNIAACFTRDHSSGITMEWIDPEWLKVGYHPVLLSFWIKTDEAVNTDVDVWMSCDGHEVLHEVRSLKDIVKASTSWQQVELTFVLPEATGSNSRLRVNLVNRSPSLLYYDDVRFAVYP